ncbi:hypothetical protein [Marinicellulosiphila megalodicopiae]|uniref:hypothetical protein n=1 Tax=Marinicellulosiphila megalodicopiae TaxID=2724896 RepID=UPI003BAE4D1C
MKILSALFISILFLASCQSDTQSGASSLTHTSKPVEYLIAENLYTKVKDPDFTIQTLTEMDLDEPTLNLWDGETLMGFYLSSHETNPYMKLLTYDFIMNNIKKELIKELNTEELIVVDRTDFIGPTELDMRSFKVSHITEDGLEIVQIMYILKQEQNLYSSVLTSVGANTFDQISARSDAIMRNAYFK